MKRYLWVLPLAMLLIAGVAFISSGRVFASGDNGNGTAPTGFVTLASITRGTVFGTAAINADGTVANCFDCDKANTSYLGTGTYQVAFNRSMPANSGWGRIVQPDTLNTGGSVAGYCTTSDRAGNPRAVFVRCFDPSGAVADISFFLY